MKRLNFLILALVASAGFSASASINPQEKILRDRAIVDLKPRPQVQVDVTNKYLVPSAEDREAGELWSELVDLHIAGFRVIGEKFGSPRAESEAAIQMAIETEVLIARLFQPEEKKKFLAAYRQYVGEVRQAVRDELILDFIDWQLGPKKTQLEEGTKLATDMLMLSLDPKAYTDADRSQAQKFCAQSRFELECLFAFGIAKN